MAVERVRSGGDFIRRSKLIVGVVELVNRLVVSICEDGCLGVMGIFVVPLFAMILGLHGLWNIFRDRVEVLVLLEGAVAARAVLATASMLSYKVVSECLLTGIKSRRTRFPVMFIMWTIFF